MADFTEIPDSNLEPDKPARSIDALALRDNPIAIAEGAAGAPRIQTPALASDAVTGQAATRSFSGSLGANATTNISYADQHGFFPRITTGGHRITAELYGNNVLRLRNMDTGASTSYAVTWRYLP